MYLKRLVWGKANLYIRLVSGGAPTQGKWAMHPISGTGHIAQVQMGENGELQLLKDLDDMEIKELRQALINDYHYINQAFDCKAVGG